MWIYSSNFPVILYSLPYIYLDTGSRWMKLWFECQIELSPTMSCSLTEKLIIFIMLTFSLHVWDFYFSLFLNCNCRLKVSWTLKLSGNVKSAGLVVCVCITSMMKFHIILGIGGFYFLNFFKFPGLITASLSESFPQVSMLHLVILFAMGMDCSFYEYDVLMYLLQWTYL